MQHTSTGLRRVDSTENSFYFTNLYACLFNGNAWSGLRSRFLRSLLFLSSLSSIGQLYSISRPRILNTLSNTLSDHTHSLGLAAVGRSTLEWLHFGLPPVVQFFLAATL